ncbi:thermonuclease family protein [Altererythrobacter sp. MF3-039]|uniref:thermonuclease family protein n=1 Tax=Altererythrobacter sp. MF3-039 TaxID=3252901 RepID=UPI00390C6087
MVFRKRDPWRRRRNPKPAKFRRKQKSWRQAWRETRPFVLLITLVTLVVIWRTPDLFPVPDMFTTTPVKVLAKFTRCDQGYTRYCVIDGDTIAIGSERIRIMGIDTPEVRAECEAEARLADIATNELRDWLNAGPFMMRGRIDEPIDRYGRQLRELYRNEGGFNAYVGQHMIDRGVARRYYGAGRDGWCD